MKQYRKQHGFNLIELMIAVALGGILMLGAGRIYVNTKQTFRITEGQSGIQENGRFALEFITRDLNRAGSMGCLSDLAWSRRHGASVSNNPDYKPPIDVLVNDPFNYVRRVIQGQPLWAVESYLVGDTNTPAELQNLLPPPKANTYILAIRGELGKSGTVTQEFNGGAGEVNVTPQLFKQNDVVMLSNCTSGVVFQVTNGDPGTGRLEHGTSGGTYSNSQSNIDPPAEPFRVGDPVFQISTAVYFVADGPTGHPALYRMLDGMPAEEVVPYVENMQVQFGQTMNEVQLEEMDLPIRATRFVPPDQITPHPFMPVGGNIMAVKITLLVRSEDEYYAEDNVLREYSLFGNQFPFTDRYKRQVYSSTSVLRNRTML